MTPVALTWASISTQRQTSSTGLSAEEVRVEVVKDKGSQIRCLFRNERCNVTFLWFSGKVLVHCHVGVSRSATLVLAYLMLKQNLTLVEAICAVKDNRGVIPNRGFLRQLIKLDGQLFGTHHWTLSDSITGWLSWVQNTRKNMINIGQITLKRWITLISLYSCVYLFYF